MEVRHSLPAVGPGIDHKPVPALHQSEALSDLDPQAHDRSKDGLSSFAVRLGGAPKMVNRDHEDVNRRLRIEVTKCEGAVGAAKYRSGNLAGRDLTEDAGHGSLGRDERLENR